MSVLQTICTEEQSRVVEEQTGCQSSEGQAQVEGTESGRLEGLGRLGMSIEEERCTRSSAGYPDPRLTDAEHPSKEPFLEFPEEPELAK